MEGVKVLFRFSIAMLELEKSSLIQALTTENNATTGDTINLIRNRANSCHDIIELKQIAFGQIKIPRRSYLSTRRAFYLKQINSQANNDIMFSSATETTVQWIRKGSEILGITFPSSSSTSQSKQMKVVFSNDHSKVALCRVNSNGGNTSTSSTSSSTSSVTSSSTSSSSSSKEIELFSCHDDLPPESNILRGPQSRNVVLAGVSNDGLKLIFCQNGNKFSVSNFINSDTDVTMIVCTVSYEVLSCFYHESTDHLITVGRNGAISRVRFGNSLDKTTPMDIETVHVGQRRHHLVTAALDIESGLLYALVADGLADSHCSQLFVVDTISLDVFNCIDLGNEPICRLFPFSGLVFVARERKDGNSVVSLTTPCFSRQLLAESEDGLNDLKAFEVNNEPNITSLPTTISTTPPNTDRQPYEQTFIVVALFNSGKIICIETTSNCIHWRRTVKINRSDASSTIVANATVTNGQLHVTLINTSLTVKKRTSIVYV